jgi:repressor LexA
MQRPRGETRERIYRFVRERLLAGRPPTVREVQEAAGLRAVESARTHLERLVADGRLAKDPGVARGYRLPGGIEGGMQPALVPMVGRVQAGGLTAAIEDPDGHVAVTSPPRGASADDLFALRVSGDSMRDAGIFEGDTVIVRRGGRPRDGHIVVALVGDEATVKTLRHVEKAGAKRGRRRVELHPANPDFEPIVPDPDQLEILGRVVEVRRSLV